MIPYDIDSIGSCQDTYTVPIVQRRHVEGAGGDPQGKRKKKEKKKKEKLKRKKEKKNRKKRKNVNYLITSNSLHIKVLFFPNLFYSQVALKNKKIVGRPYAKLSVCK